MAGTGCTSPRQVCPESPSYFFHTTDQNHPWVEIDLERKVRFSGVRVENRRDCCEERAVPLVVEAADESRKFRVLAQRDKSFDSWLASFPPTEARYVRVRILRPSLLHLGRVRVLR